MYIITAKKVQVRSTADMNSKKGNKLLRKGMRVKVAEVIFLEESPQARIEDPAGWISLVNTENGFRLASREASSVDDVPAQANVGEKTGQASSSGKWQWKKLQPACDIIDISSDDEGADENAAFDDALARRDGQEDDRSAIKRAMEESSRKLELMIKEQGPDSLMRAINESKALAQREHEERKREEDEFMAVRLASCYEVGMSEQDIRAIIDDQAGGGTPAKRRRVRPSEPTPAASDTTPGDPCDALVSMGFAWQDAQHALRDASGDVAQAVAMLVSR